MTSWRHDVITWLHRDIYHLRLHASYRDEFFFVFNFFHVGKNSKHKINVVTSWHYDAMTSWHDFMYRDIVTYTISACLQAISRWIFFSIFFHVGKYSKHKINVVTSWHHDVMTSWHDFIVTYIISACMQAIAIIFLVSNFFHVGKTILVNTKSMSWRHDIMTSWHDFIVTYTACMQAISMNLFLFLTIIIIAVDFRPNTHNKQKATL
jgi:heme/copper-type cytochrome/quinol oxidase subunit 2